MQTVEDFARQAALPDWSLVRRVLFIRLRSIGDTVLMTPSLAALKGWRPDAETYVLSEPLSAPLLEDHPLVDRLMVVGPSLISRARLVASLRRERFDVAFNMHGGSTATMLAALSGARYTIGYGGYHYSWMLSARAPSPDVIVGRTRLHSVEQQLALLHWSGVPWPGERPQLSLNVQEEAKARMHERLAALNVARPGGSRFLRRDFAIIAPSAAFESKRWHTTGFAATVDHLAEKWNLPSVVIAGPGQDHIARQVADGSHAKPPVLSGLSLKELVALVGLTRVFVGNDSGPAHVAAALSRPLVVIFGPSDANVWHPWTRSPYRVIGGQVDTSITSVSVNEVIAAVDEVLEPAAAINKG